MTEYHNEELRLINQMLLAIFLITDFAYFLFLKNSPFPWFALAGSAIGLATIVFCWSGNKYLIFNIMLLISAAVFSLAYNWSSIF